MQFFKFSSIFPWKDQRLGKRSVFDCSEERIFTSLEHGTLCILRQTNHPQLQKINMGGAYLHRSMHERNQSQVHESISIWLRCLTVMRRSRRQAGTPSKLTKILIEGQHDPCFSRGPCQYGFIFHSQRGGMNPNDVVP